MPYDTRLVLNLQVVLPAAVFPALRRTFVNLPCSFAQRVQIVGSVLSFLVRCLRRYLNAR